MLGSSAAGVAALVGGGIWWASRQRVDARFQALVEQAREAIRRQSIDQQTVRILEQALSIRPRSAQTLGLLSLVKSLIAQSADPKEAAGLVADAERTAQRALSIDPKEPNALLAMFELQGSTLNWFTRDQKLRQIIGIDPKNVVAIADLVLLTQATGFNRESWAWNERALSLVPLSADFLGKRALKLWILGRTSEADKVSDQLRGLYPTNEWAWRVRFVIYAFTGRARAAQAMLDGDPTMGGSPTHARLWKASLPALDQPSPETTANARKVAGTELVSDAVQVMSALHEMDTAFDIANGLLLSRGPLVRPEKPGSTWTAQEASWRINTQWMFSPPVAPMRADPRFLRLCDNIGLTEYWKARNTRPDYQRT